MPTTKECIRRWMTSAKKEGATHLAVVCDTFENDDYPVFIKKIPYAEKPLEGGGPKVGYELVKRVHDVKEYLNKNFSPSNMQKVMEVYRLADDWEEQLKEYRVFRYE